MDGGNQNNGQGGEKKAQLSWSQPITTSPSNQKPVEQKNIQKTPVMPPKPSAIDTPNKTNTFKNVVITVVVIAAIAAVWAVIASNKNTGTSQAGTNNIMATSTTGNMSSMADGSFSIPSPQDAGLQVAVSKVIVTVPTWVVIYESSNGQPGNVLGAALFVDGRTSGPVDLLRGTMSGQSYFVGESRDDGDHMYSMKNDMPVLDADGNPIMLKFQTK